MPIDDVFFGLADRRRALAVIVLWWVANAWYYLTYEPIETKREKSNSNKTQPGRSSSPAPSSGSPSLATPLITNKKLWRPAFSWLKASPLSRWLR